MNDNPILESTKLEDFSEKQLPSTLNVLTILSIIGSSFYLITGFTSYFTACSNIDKLEKASSQDGLPEWAQNLMGASLEMSEKLCDNRLTMMIVALVAGSLCLMGAIYMRRRKKTGFMLYSVGEFIPPLANIVILGVGSTITLVSNIFSLVWAGLWVLLYFFQLKHLNKN